MNFESLKVLLLHNHPEYLKQCCDLINDEWSRSETARMMSLQASCDSLPTSLILVQDDNVIGHCKLTPIPSIPESCFIETVVISKKLRGMKLGSYLMKKVEEYCRDSLKLKMCHLSTKGQEDFYSKLGYKLCAPISIYGTSIKVNESHIEDKKVPISRKPIEVKCESTVAPPPPPMPKLETPPSAPVKSNKTFMFKYLS